MSWWIKRKLNKTVTDKTKKGLYDNRQQFQKFYQSSAWQKLRLYILVCYPICQLCNRAAATEVDHIIPLSINYSLRLTESNCQALCKSCHSAKTIQEQKDKKQQQRNNIIDDNMDQLNDLKV